MQRRTLYTCRPAGAKNEGGNPLLHTYRPAGAKVRCGNVTVANFQSSNHPLKMLGFNRFWLDGTLMRISYFSIVFRDLMAAVQPNLHAKMTGCSASEGEGTSPLRIRGGNSKDVGFQSVLVGRDIYEDILFFSELTQF